jgi:glycosyltransferase involved in cell wall biosynthesis
MDIQVELIGEGALELVLKRLAQKLGIGDKTLFRGWLPFDEVRTAMGETTILVLPSLGDAVPTVIKEAMALGTPVISTRVGGIPELLDNGRCGILVSPKDVSALATAIKLLLQDERARKHYAREARRRAEQMFDLWRNGKQLANLLKSTTRTKQGKFPKLYRDPLAEQ